METSFARVIEDHLELKRRRASETRSDANDGDVKLDDSPTATGNSLLPDAPDYEESVWGRAREFDWGD